MRSIALVPTLILQPLVENAVRHGVLPRESGGSFGVEWVREGTSPDWLCRWRRMMVPDSRAA